MSSVATTHTSPSSRECATHTSVTTLARTEIIVPTILQLVAALYLSQYVDRGWFPSDEGLIAHSAERVLQGELPHRDFDSPYTGGLSMLHAGAFAIGGVSLVTLRWCLFAFAQLFIASLYIIARRSLSLMSATMVTALVIIWGLPVYFAAMPSWYVLFFEFAATVCILRYMDTDNRKWLSLAGVLCGLSFLIKITVLYYIAAVLLFFLFRTQCQTPRDNNSIRSMGVSGLTLSISTALSLIVAALLSTRFSSRAGVQLLLPILGVCLVLVLHERRSSDTFTSRLAALLRDIIPFTFGAAIPILLFVIPYWQSDSIELLLKGVFIVPQRRFESVPWPLPPLTWMVTVVPLMLALYYRRADLSGRGSRFLIGSSLTLLLLLSYMLAESPLAFNSVWASIRCAAPAVVIAGCWACLTDKGSGQSRESSANDRQIVFLLTAAAALTGLVQFPMASNPYFLFFAPFAFLTAACAARLAFSELQFRHSAVAWFYLLFGILILNRTYVANPKLSFYEVHQHSMNTTRCGLLVSEQDQQIYNEIIHLVQQSTSVDEFVYAAPDCPEIYFLANRRNPTRTMYDVFDEPAGRHERIVQILDDPRTQSVVLNMSPLFSGKASPELRKAILDRFPVVRQVGSFAVALRE